MKAVQSIYAGEVLSSIWDAASSDSDQEGSEQGAPPEQELVPKRPSSSEEDEPGVCSMIQQQPAHCCGPGTEVFACEKCGREFGYLHLAEKHERECGGWPHAVGPATRGTARCGVLSNAGRPCSQPQATCPYHSPMVNSLSPLIVTTGSLEWIW